MARFCKDLKEHATSLMKNKMLVIYAKKDLLMVTVKNIIMSEIIVITQENVEELLMIIVT